MITWNGRHGDFVRFAIEGYEQPDITEGDDANWVRIEIVG